MFKDDEPNRRPYREALAAIGCYFDRHLYRGVFLAEVPDGYIGKAHPAEEHAELRAEGFTFPSSDVEALIADTDERDVVPESTPPFCPSGYKVFLRAVGAMCDHASAQHVSLLETTSGFVLGLSVPAKQQRRLERRRILLDRGGIDELLSKVSA